MTPFSFLLFINGFAGGDCHIVLSGKYRKSTGTHQLLFTLAPCGSLITPSSKGKWQ